MLKLIKQSFRKWFESSTIHGLPKIFHSNRRTIKLMWIIFFLLASVSSILLIAQNVKEFLKYEVVSQLKVINELRSPFPT